MRVQHKTLQAQQITNVDRPLESDLIHFDKLGSCAWKQLPFSLSGCTIADSSQ